MSCLHFKPKFLRQKRKVYPELREGIHRIESDIKDLPFEEAKEYLLRPSIGGKNPRINVDKSHHEIFHFYPNGNLNTYRVLYIVNKVEQRIEFLSIVEPKDHFSIKKVAEREIDYLSREQKSYSYLSPVLQETPENLDKKLFFELDEDQTRIIKEMIHDDHQSYFVMGRAGTGKTVSAIEMLKALYFQNLHPIYVTFTQNLLNETKDQLDIASFPTDACLTFHELLKIPKFPIDAFLTIIEDLLYLVPQTIKLNYPDIFDKDFLYKVFRGFFKGSLDKENGYLRFENEQAMNKRLKGFKEFQLYSDEQKQTIIHHIFMIYHQYEIIKKEMNLVEDNDFELPQEAQYQALVVDEVQDLTEYQILALLKLCKTNRIYFFGDANQIINPTYFELGRVSYFLEQLHYPKPKILFLKHNYRNAKKIIQYTNYLNHIKQTYLKKDDVVIEYQNLAMLSYEQRNDTHSIGFVNDEQVIHQLFHLLQSAADITIIVNDEDDKQEIIERYQLQKDPLRKFILTVNEFKGLENTNVVLFNLIHKNRKAFIDILERNNNRRMHERLFNKYYVAVTRGVKSVILCETHPLPDLIHDLLLKVPYDGELKKFEKIKKIEHASEFDNFITFSTDPKVYIEIGEKFMQFEKYVQAIEKFFYALSLMEEETPWDQVMAYRKRLQVFQQRTAIQDRIVECIQNHQSIEGHEPLDWEENFSRAKEYMLDKVVMNYLPSMDTPELSHLRFETLIWATVQGNQEALNMFSSLVDEHNEKGNECRYKYHVLAQTPSDAFDSSTLNMSFERKISLCLELAQKQFQYILAYQELKKIAEQSHQTIPLDGKFYYELALHYEMQNDLEQWIYFLKQAAQRQTRAAKFELGKYYLQHPDEEQKTYAFNMLLQAAESEYKEAYLYLGFAYKQGTGTKENPTEAYKYFYLSYEQSRMIEAYYEVGLCWELGYGVDQSFVEAYKFYRYGQKEGNYLSDLKCHDSQFLFSMALEMMEGKREKKQMVSANKLLKELKEKDFEPAIEILKNPHHFLAIIDELYTARRYREITAVYKSNHPILIDAPLIIDQMVKIFTSLHASRAYLDSFVLLKRIERYYVKELQLNPQQNAIGFIERVMGDQAYVRIDKKILENLPGEDEEENFISMVYFEVKKIDFKPVRYDIVLIRDFENVKTQQRFDREFNYTSDDVILLSKHE
jgi:hypothetical protein